MRRIYLASALLLSAMAFGSASAAPAQYEKGISSREGLSSDSAIIKVRDYRPHAGPRPARRPHYRAGGRYRSAPHGWHRYRARPGDWRTRGCILVGPVWFCP